MMKLLFYGCSAYWIGCREMTVDVAGAEPLQDILKSTPKLAPILAHRETLLVSVNCEVCAFDATVRDTDEVAFLPPFGDG